MNNNKRYASAVACGISQVSEPGVIVAFYGPRGGTRSIEEVTPAQARALARGLTAAADALAPEFD